MKWEGGLLEHINPKIVSIGLALRSLYLVSQYIPLSDAEAQAISYHDGMYVPEGRSVAHKEEPLLLLLHWADMWTASVKEKVKINWRKLAKRGQKGVETELKRV